MGDLLVDLEVVDGLGENTGPVDRVDCAEMVFLVEGLVAPRGAPSQCPKS